METGKNKFLGNEREIWVETVWLRHSLSSLIFFDVANFVYRGRMDKTGALFVVKIHSKQTRGKQIPLPCTFEEVLELISVGIVLNKPIAKFQHCLEFLS